MKELTVLENNNERVLTTKQLAEVYETKENNIKNNFNNNKDRFIEDKHYYRLTGEELKQFKNLVNDIDLVDKRTPSLILWTKRGASRMCKILDTDKAWEQFDILEDTYFNIEKIKNKLLEEKMKLELEAKNRTILRLESENHKISKILQADRYISNEMYGEPTYIASIVINILKKCSTKKNILKYEDDIYFIKSEPVKEEFMKYRIKPAEFKRYVEYFGGCQTRIKCKVKGGEYNIPIGCYAIPGFIIDWNMKDSVKRLSY